MTGSSRSPEPCHDAHAAPAASHETHVEIYDAVRLFKLTFLDRSQTLFAEEQYIK